MVGAGSVITENVEDNAMAVARAPQVNKAGKASEFRKRQKKA
jgi:bifunctional N-acetylglucosamine-1-phosphate-uridyltransferase/glucosamine-1-phosphate-acetyltransferase GlmU-like protein